MWFLPDVTKKPRRPMSVYERPGAVSCEPLYMPMPLLRQDYTCWYSGVLRPPVDIVTIFGV